ncbi:hypothetical protein EI533_21310 [Pseudomonas donghuensis]|nr:hypothetical protein [Pseudomonas donghuensis]
MKAYKTCSALIATAFLFLHGCENPEGHIYQANRCAVAYSMGSNVDPSVVTNAALETGQYMRAHGINKSVAELTAMTDKVKDEIMGTPDAPYKGWEGRADRISESDFCKKYLSSLQAQ